MILQYTLTAEDWTALELHHYERAPLANNIKRYLPPVIFVTAGLLLPKIFSFLPLAITIAAYGVVAVLWIVLFPKFKHRFHRGTYNMRISRIRKIVARKIKRVPDMLTKRSLSLTEEYLISISDAGESRIRWQTFTSYAITEKHYFIYYYNGVTMGFVIPRNLFIAHPDEEGFLLSMLKDTPINEHSNFAAA